MNEAELSQLKDALEAARARANEARKAYDAAPGAAYVELVDALKILIDAQAAYAAAINGPEVDRPPPDTMPPKPPANALRFRSPFGTCKA